MPLLLVAIALFLAVLPAAAQVAVDPIRNRVYIAEESSNRVAVIDGATGATTSYVPVGNRPQFIAVNPLNGRIYVNNGADASLTVIEAATLTTQTLPIGSTGPIAINPQTGKVYVVRYSTAATDEVTIVDEAALSWYSIATQSFQPMAVAVDPGTNLVYVAHYAAGHIRVIDGSSTSDHPPSTEIGVWGKSMAITVNPATHRAYSLQEDPRGPIAMITPDNQAQFLAPEGHAQGPRAIAVNPVTNKVYAAFAGEVIVMDGDTFQVLAFIPSGTAEAGPQALGINTATNKVYVPNADGTLTIIDGATEAASTIEIPAGATGIGVNPLTNKYYIAGETAAIVNGGASDSRQPNSIVTSITPLPGNSSGASATITLVPSSGFPGNTVLAVYYQLDGAGPWKRASGSGPYTASLTGLANGSHTLRAFAVDAQAAPVAVNERQSAPLLGTIASYTFTAGGAAPPAVVGDFNGNGTGDLVFEHSDGRSAVWLMDGTTVASGAGIMGVGTGWHVARIADFDGDGRSDVAWQHGDGRMAIYLMDGTVPTSTKQLLNAGDGWTVVGAPDLDGDGRADLLFRHADGSIAAWTLAGTTVTSGATLIGPASGWSVAATGDLDGDGKDDIVWKHADGRHAVSLMSGKTILSTTQILNAGSWTATHVADLDGDGKADIVWKNADGTVAAWRMNGAAMVTGAQLIGAGTGWSVALTGDFNGDGKADLLFENADGRAAVYLMNGVSPGATAQLLNAGSGWTAARIVDLDGDGKDDIVWKHTDGSIAAWLMNGTAMAHGATLMGAGSGWSVVSAP